MKTFVLLGIPIQCNNNVKWLLSENSGVIIIICCLSVVVDWTKSLIYGVNNYSTELAAGLDFE